MNKLLKYKKYLPTLLFILGVVLLLITIFSQGPRLFSLLSEYEDLARQTDEKRLKLNSVRQISGQQIEDQLDLVSTALPSEKNATLIYSGITSVAAKHAVEVKNFSIDVGDVFISNDTGDTSVQELVVQLDVVSPSYINTRLFITDLYRSLPISEIENVRLVEGEGQMSLIFFYKREEATPQVSSAISATQQDILDEISTWNRP